MAARLTWRGRNASVVTLATQDITTYNGSYKGVSIRDSPITGKANSQLPMSCSSSVRQPARDDTFKRVQPI